jgi:hypothetical protein
VSGGRFRLRRPAEVDPLLWELASRGVRLVLMEAHAKTPEARRAAQVERARYTVSELERAVRMLEGSGPGGER